MALFIFPWALGDAFGAQVNSHPAIAPTSTASASAGNSKPDQLPEVTIEAGRQALENRVRRFVGKLTHSSRFSDDSVPRWEQPLCFLVAGLPSTQGEFVIGRLSQVAISVGARIRNAGCSNQDANFRVIFTANPDRTLKALRHHPGRLFHSDAAPRQLEHFLNPPGADVVRVWHNAELVSRNGMPLMEDNSACLSMPGVLINCDARTERSPLQRQRIVTQLTAEVSH